MKKMQMNIENDITFLQGCDEYILDCMARKLRNGTLRHYNDSKSRQATD